MLHHVDNLKTNEGLRLNDAPDGLYAETEPRQLVFKIANDPATDVPTVKTWFIHQTGIDSPLKEASNSNTSEVGSPEQQPGDT